MSIKAAILSQQPTANSQQPNLVSIIIPAYNTEQYIHRAIESSIRQTYKNIEIIIVDDGSTDGTFRVAQGYEAQDSRIRVIHQENKGVSSARNHGIREAHGEYIMFLDSDDWLENDAVEILLEAQLKYPDRLISASNYLVEIDDKNKIFRRAKYKRKSDDSLLSIEETLLMTYLGLGNIWCKIYTKDTIRKNNIYFREDVYYGEDLIFGSLYLLKTQGMFYMDKPLVNIVQRQDSAMRQKCYDNRKLFVDGKIKDWVQVIIDNPENTPEVKRLFKLRHTKKFFTHLRGAVLTHGSTSAINQLIEKIRLYLPEYINFHHDDMPLTQKLYYYCILYLPLPLARPLCKVRIRTRDFINKTKNFFGLGRKKDEEEIINFW